MRLLAAFLSLVLFTVTSVGSAQQPFRDQAPFSLIPIDGLSGSFHRGFLLRAYRQSLGQLKEVHPCLGYQGRRISSPVIVIADGSIDLADENRVLSILEPVRSGLFKVCSRLALGWDCGNTVEKYRDRDNCRSYLPEPMNILIYRGDVAAENWETAWVVGAGVKRDPRETDFRSITIYVPVHKAAFGSYHNKLLDQMEGRDVSDRPTVFDRAQAQRSENERRKSAAERRASEHLRASGYGL